MKEWTGRRAEQMQDVLTKKGETVSLPVSGFRGTARAGLTLYRGKYYYWKHDGTGNYFFYAPVVREVSKDEAIEILLENKKDKESFFEACKKLQIEIDEEEYESLLFS